MKYQAALLAVAGLATARELSLHYAVAKREVPQEHSHAAIVRTTQKALVIDNPDEIVDAIFGLLGTDAAAVGKGKVANPDCLQQIVADQAFTNAKKVGDLDGQANAIMYRALERNTLGVGKESVACNETAKNPQIAAIKQHQDPASPAASGNKKIALDVAKQLKAIGADPNLAINTGTFPPGDPKDVLFKGKSCNDEKDTAGCIFTLKLLVPDVTKEEIAAAVGGKKKAGAGGKNV